MSKPAGKPAVIVVDMLNDFVTGALANPRAARIIPPLEGLIAAAHRTGVPVIHCTDAHLPGVDPELALWGDHAVAGTEGAQVIPELAPAKGDLVVPKRRYSGFFQTDLLSLLRDLDVDTLIITGMLTDICVCHTAADAYQWGFTVITPEDGCEALDDAAHEGALATMKALYAADITTCAKAAADWH